MNRARCSEAALQLSLAEQRVAGALELARRGGDAVAVHSLERAGSHLRGLRAIMEADRLEALQAEVAPGEWQGGAPDFWEQQRAPFGAAERE